MVNWKFFFILGIILSVVPFQFEVYEYVFLYANLGYGLMLLSFIIRIPQPENPIMVIFIGLTLLLSLSNFFAEYYLMYFILYFVLSIIIFIRSEKNVPILLCTLLFITFPPMIILAVLNYLGFNLYSQVPNIGVYVFPGIVILSLLFNKTMNSRVELLITEE